MSDRTDQRERRRKALARFEAVTEVPLLLLALALLEQEDVIRRLDEFTSELTIVKAELRRLGRRVGQTRSEADP